MPALLPAVIAGAAAGGAALLTGATATLFGSVFLGAAIPAFASTLVVGLLTKATAKKPDQSAQITAQGRTISVRQPVPPQQLIYGRVRTGGTPTYITITQSGSAYNTVLTMAGHVCDAIEEVLADDYVMTLDAAGIETGRYSAGGGVYAVVHRATGAETGQPFPALVAETGGAWGSTTHLQRGHAKLYARLAASPDLFPNGVPNLTAVVRGKRVFDPRTGLTAWSHNPALCLADYLCDTRFGLGCSYASRIDEATLIAAANACDERVLLAVQTAGFTANVTTDVITLDSGARIPQTGDGVRVASSGTLPGGLSAATTYYVIARTRGFLLATSYANAMAGTAIDITSAGSGTHTLTYYDEPRYTLNGTINSNEKPREVMGRMLAAMAGSAVRVGGKWYIRAGAYTAPTLTLTEHDLAGPVRVQSLLSRRESCNGVKGVYSEPTSLWQPNDFPAQQGAAYLALDNNERVWRDADYSGFVTRGNQGQRLAKIELLRTRQGLTVQAPFKLTAYRAMTGGTVALTLARFGWTAKVFDVVGSRFIVGDDGALGVELSLRETAAAVYDWSTSDESPIDIAPNTEFPPPSAPTAPGVPGITEELYETTGSAGVKSRAVVSWTAPAGVTVLGYELQFKLASASDWISRPLSVSAEDLIDDLAPGLYDFRVRVVNIAGGVSAWTSTVTRQLLGLTAAPADVTGFSVIKSGGVGYAQWTLHPDLDVRQGGAIVVRHSPLTSGAVWADGVIYEEFAGNAVNGSIALKTGTYMVKARDSSGNWSTTAATFVATEGLVTGFTTAGSVTEHTAFSGSKTDVVYDGGLGGIKLDTGDALGTYTFNSTLDLTTVATRRFESSLEALSYDEGVLFDSTPGDFDDASGTFDGTEINDCDVTLYGRFTDDNPAGSPTWGPWVPFFVADFTCRAAQFKAELTRVNTNHNIVVTELSVAAKIPA